MRRLLPIVTVLVVGVAALLMTRCTSVTGGAPTGVVLASATDSTVIISWTAPTEGTPDKYYVAFMATGTSSYTNIDTTTATSYTHDPAGQTGTYKVTAVFGSSTYDAATNPSTVPNHTAATTVYELNESGNSGYGWDRTGGGGTTYSMANAANAADVDFYVSDWATTTNGNPYYLVSPDIGPTDPGNAVPAGSWRVNGVSDLVPEQGPLKAHVTGNYTSSQELTQYPFICGVWTADGYFGLLKVDSYNPGSGTVSVESWFQTVKGLRLVQH